jgi:hypothetical protein
MVLASEVLTHIWRPTEARPVSVKPEEHTHAPFEKSMFGSGHDWQV